LTPRTSEMTKIKSRTRPTIRNTFTHGGIPVTGSRRGSASVFLRMLDGGSPLAIFLDRKGTIGGRKVTRQLVYDKAFCIDTRHRV
jgi:hypothetical protein